MLPKRLHNILSCRGWVNTSVCVLISCALAFLLLVYPVLLATVWKNVSVSPTVPLPPKRDLVDPSTPEHARTWTPYRGKLYKLVFSDEFNQPHRTFGPNHDPFWQAVDLHYWPTGDQEYYKPEQVTTAKGNLRIRIERKKVGGLNYASGMLQSWNKLCLRGGYLEARVSLPGSGHISGYWSSIWLLGNLARAGYGATTEGLWPYSYNTCDQGVLKHQNNSQLSHLFGQRLSACLCHDQDTPSPGIGRNGVELDLFEASSSPDWGPTASQSHQFAPFDADRRIDESYITIFDPVKTRLNSYRGGLLQQTVSFVTSVNEEAFEEHAYTVFGVEYVPGEHGWVQWYVDGKPTCRLDARAVDKNAASGVAQRLIANEPMSIIINVGMSDSFSPIDHEHLPPHATMSVDYIRLYQPPERTDLGCDPPDMPTATYIRDHRRAYEVWNYTTWAQAGYTWPQSKLNPSCAA
jgi:beta-glucanase (GH16 family)